MKAALVILCGWWGTLIVVAMVLAAGTVLNPELEVAWEMANRQWQMVKARVWKVWWAATCNVDCAWCGKRMWRAVLPVRFRLGPGHWVPRISHSICVECAGQELEKTKRLIAVALAEEKAESRKQKAESGGARGEVGMANGKSQIANGEEAERRELWRGHDSMEANLRKRF